MPEVRLIDANVLYDRLEYRYKNSYGAAHRAYGIAIDEVCDAPTITPESLVRHGRFEVGELADGNGEMLYCSECKHPYMSTVGMNYCPNCGARMDMKE